jgi:hypothetical protein
LRVSDQKVMHAFTKPGDYFVNVTPPASQELAAGTDLSTSVVRSAPTQPGSSVVGAFPEGSSVVRGDIGGPGGLFGGTVFRWTAWELHKLGITKPVDMATTLCALTDAGHIRQLVKDESADLREFESGKWRSKGHSEKDIDGPVQQPWKEFVSEFLLLRVGVEEPIGADKLTEARGLPPDQEPPPKVSPAPAPSHGPGGAASGGTGSVGPARKVEKTAPEEAAAKQVKKKAKTAHDQEQTGGFVQKAKRAQDGYIKSAHDAARSGDVAAFDRAVCAGKKVGVDFSQADVSLVFTAAGCVAEVQGGHDKIIDTAVKRLRVDPNSRNSKGITPAWIAVYRNNVFCLQALHKSGADLDVVTDSGSPLWQAAAMGHIGCVKYLVEKAGAVICGNRGPGAGAGMTPRGIAEQYGHYNVSEYLKHL